MGVLVELVLGSENLTVLCKTVRLRLAVYQT